MLMSLVTAPLRAAAASSRMALNATNQSLDKPSAPRWSPAKRWRMLAGPPPNAALDLGALSRAAMGIAVKALGGPPTRRVSANGPRRRIEVRGLDGADGTVYGHRAPDREIDIGLPRFADDPS
jgi:hypothetical protein